MNDATQKEAGTQATGVVIINEAGTFVDANERAAEIVGRELGELLTLSIEDVLLDPSPRHGRNLERNLNGAELEEELDVLRGDGSVVRVQAEAEATTLDGERHISSEFEVIEEVERPTSEPDFETPDPTVFEDINDEELVDIVQNIRVDAPDGKMPLNAIMLDLAVGHNELEQYKAGALTMHKAVDERLQEAEEQNANETHCEVLREVKESAYGLYLRLQRGDEELHGERDGRYSGYFN